MVAVYFKYTSVAGILKCTDKFCFFFLTQMNNPMGTGRINFLRLSLQQRQFHISKHSILYTVGDQLTTIEWISILVKIEKIM